MPWGTIVTFVADKKGILANIWGIRGVEEGGKPNAGAWTEVRWLKRSGWQIYVTLTTTLSGQIWSQKAYSTTYQFQIIHCSIQGDCQILLCRFGLQKGGGVPPKIRNKAKIVLL